MGSASGSAELTREVVSVDREKEVNLRYHDLIVVPFPSRRPGIYWLRLYEGTEHDVAVLTEVPGNPSWSIANGRMRILEWIVREYGITPDRLILFEVHPQGSAGPNVAGVTRFEPLGKPRPASREEIESLVGSRLPELPSHADLLARVFQLGGGRTGTAYRILFESIPTVDLPPPRDLIKCPHHDLFLRRKAARPELARSWEIVTTKDWATCPYHDAHWKVIADESVRILRSVSGGDQARYCEKAAEAKLQDRDLRILLSLFTDPVRILRGEYDNGQDSFFIDPVQLLQGEYDNGQHRACGLRFSGAAEAVISPGEEELEADVAVWTYMGDG